MENLCFGFGGALNRLKGGECVSRQGWNGKGMSLELQTPDEHSKMNLPYIYMNIPKYSEDGSLLHTNRIPWLASQTDLLADDWYLVV